MQVNWHNLFIKRVRCGGVSGLLNRASVMVHIKDHFLLAAPLTD